MNPMYLLNVFISVIVYVYYIWIMNLQENWILAIVVDGMELPRKIQRAAEEVGFTGIGIRRFLVCQHITQATGQYMRQL